MTDPARHKLISFKTMNEAETFKMVLNNTFGNFAFVEVIIEGTVEPAPNRYEVIALSRRLHVPKRVLAFVIGWASATTYHVESVEAMVLASSGTSLFLYR